MDYLRQTQADIMLVLIGICGVIALFIFLTNTMSAKRKRILILLELSAMFLLIADRRAYIFRGDPSPLGWWAVRISNFRTVQTIFLYQTAYAYCIRDSNDLY